MKRYALLSAVLLSIVVLTSCTDSKESSQNIEESRPRIHETFKQNPAEIKAHLKRAKRTLIIPGTNWCGVGNVSRDNSEVGEIASADKCCREHDHCPYVIEGMTTKYNMYNFRFHTISHCECDDIFRTCLRMSSNAQADIVGELFFNYIGMKCFIFKQETVCAQRTWWGKCERQKVQWTAETRDPLTYMY